MIRLAVACVLLIPAAAMAQGNPGPYGRLFGREAASTNRNQTDLEIRSDVAGQYDSALLAPEGQRLDRDTQRGVASGGTVALVFDHAADKLSATMRGAISRQQFFREPQQYGVNKYNADAALNYRVTTRLEANAAAGYGHSPSYQYMQGFGGSDAVTIDTTLMPFSPYAVAMLENETIDGSLGLSAELAQRSHVSASVTEHRTTFAQQPENDFESSGFRATFTHDITRGFGLHAEYGRDHIKPMTLSAAAYDNEVIDIGVDFNHALSLARRTTLEFRTSTSVSRRTGYEDQFRINGGISFARFFRRTWSVTAEARRSTQYLAGFVEPIYSDLIGASLSGMFSKRLEFVTAVAAGQGEYAFSGRSGFNTSSATARLGYAISRHIQMYGQYVAFLSEVPPGSTLIGLPGRTGRQVVSVGLGAYVPVYHKVRTGQ